ncbi:S28 family serine protease [Carboxylicivirga linearis]|uniref:Peptidase n=1 Tax=Carboxylicivirga linearis TaxID=1628157 RepID=A0ABS5JSW5_9BACT|nr:S28 family serine protease [Carboxylicivirga linearis]MBS2097965.1 peptidase [Carboxylicivirga linearis]
MNKLLLVTLLVAATLSSCVSKPQSLQQLLNSDYIVSCDSVQADTSLFKNAYLIQFKQPVDHNDPGKGTFTQRIWLSHYNADAPVVIVTEGYSANRNYTTELAQMLKTNQIIVEHRYFEDSKPDINDWQYLNIEQAAKDHHKIIEFFKQFYTGKWISTGISKGGQTSIYHRSYFPDDVDISVPYVAPINFGREEDRLFDFFNKVGTAEDRQKINDFQLAVLNHRDELMILFEQLAEEKGYTYRMGLDKAFDLTVLEYPFSFWQWHGDTDHIPETTATTQELFDHLAQYSDFSYPADQIWEGIKPFFYQAYTELGYYGYITGDMKPLLKGFDQDTISSSLFAPDSKNLQFNDEAMPNVMERLKQSNPKILAIVGGTDPWGATSIITDDLTNTVKIVKADGNHRTRINNLNKEQKSQAITQLEKWLEE